MANIFSLKSVADIKGARVTMDTKIGTSIYVTLADGKVFEFKQFNNGLYYFDTAASVCSNKPKDIVNNYSMVHTVSNNKSYFTANDIKGADLSRKYQ